MVWRAFATGSGEKDAIGSEGGIVLLDEVYDDAARITLERDTQCKAPAAITCGIFGWMVHTRFFSGLAEGLHAYEAMKVDLAGIVDRIPLEAAPDRDAQMKDVTKAISVFVEKYP